MYLEIAMKHLRDGKKVTRIDWDGYMALRFNQTKQYPVIAFYRQNGDLVQADTIFQSEDLLADD